MQIGIDLTGGESSPISLFKAVVEASKLSHIDVFFHVFVSKELRENIQKSYPSLSQNIIFTVVYDYISMHENPLLAVKDHSDSSIVLGMRAIKEKQLDAFISCGHTGALVVSAKLILGTFGKIKSPGLLAFVPTKKYKVAVIDVGANISYKPENFVKYAIMGSIVQKLIHQIALPKVGLLNIGVESKKGTANYQKAHDVLMESKNKIYEFIGNIEPNEIFNGEVDVVVCDGFMGNILLKTAEGIVNFIHSRISEKIESNQASEIFESIEKEKYSGAILCGVNGLVIKCHGNSSWRSLLGAINKSIFLVEQNFISNLNLFFSSN